MKYLIEIDVDVLTLRNSDGEFDEETSLKGLIEREMGWLEQSGISLVKFVDNYLEKD